MIPYEKISLISEKENNKVWLASAKDLDTVVVVKEITHANTDIFDCIASMNNPHIPHILSMETQNDITIIVEEYISGLPLNRYIKEKNLSEHEIIDLFLQACDGIKVLHEQKPPIIHRDLKPSNLLVSSDGIVKIIDFDASRKYKETADTDTRHLGTAAFAPPEQYGYSQTDVRSDIYSLGAVMYETFFGKQLPRIPSENAFHAKNLYHSEHKLHKNLIHIIEKCTMFNPSARYKNIEELQHALQTYTNKSKAPFAICLVAVLALFILIGGAVALSQKQNNTEITDQYTNTPNPAILTEAIPSQSPSATEETPQTPVPAETEKKTKKTAKKAKPASDKTDTPEASPKNITDANKIKNAKTNKKATTQKNTSAKKKTSVSETPVPVTVNYTGKTTYYLDMYNTKTKETEILTYYYLKKAPALTPINVACGLLTTYSLENVYLEDTTKETTVAIPTKYWSLKCNHIVKISDKYLSTLKLNNTYNIILDCDNAIILSKLKLINNLNKVTTPFNQCSITPGCLEYSPKNPAAMTLAIANAYGRKITKITIRSTGKTVSSKYYTVDYKNGYLTFKKSFFKEFSDGSYIMLRIYHSQIDQLSDNGYADYSFVAKTTEYIPPQIISGTFSFDLDNPKNLSFEMDWNDGKGKLDSIYLYKSDLPALTADDYTITDTHIILKKDYFMKLDKGVYELCFQFGEIGIVYGLTIE